MIINQCLKVFIRVLSCKFIVNDLDIDKGFGSIRQSVMTTKKTFLAKIGLLKYLWNMVLRFLSVSRNGNTSICLC